MGHVLTGSTRGLKLAERIGRTDTPKHRPQSHSAISLVMTPPFARPADEAPRTRVWPNASAGVLVEEVTW